MIITSSEIRFFSFIVNTSHEDLHDNEFYSNIIFSETEWEPVFT